MSPRRRGTAAPRSRGSRSRPGGEGPAGPGSSPRTGAAPAAPTRWTRWVAYGFIALFAIYWVVQAFAHHRLGNYAVETDFYWKYGPAARDLTHGAIDIGNYDSKGWGYPAVVAAISMLGLDTFRAAQVVALLSAILSLLLVYRLHRSLFGPGLALAALLVLAGNRIFIANTYEVGTDMFFLAVSMASIALLLRSRDPGWVAIVGSGLLAGWGFSTRYNGLVAWPGALALFLLLRIPAGPPAARWRRAGVYTAAFLAGALPWLWINAAHTGNPLTNSNYVNVGYAVYGEGNWEKYFYGGTRQIHTLVDVVRMDPGRFALAMVRNVPAHLRQDLFELLTPIWGFLAIVGALLMVRDRPGRRVGGYLLFGALGFVTMVPVFYSVRFSLAILPFYVALVTWAFGSPQVARAVAGIERVFPVRAFTFLALWIPIALASYTWSQNPVNQEAVRSGPYDLADAVAFLKQQPSGNALMARKPHAAFLAGMRFVAMPEVSSVDSLRAAALRERTRYVLISSIEYRTRRVAQQLSSMPTPPPGWRRVFDSEGGQVYVVLP